MLLYFLIFTAVFAALVIGMIGYSRFMFQKIYGDMREQIECVAAGSVPPEWDKRLARRVSRCRNEKGRAAAVAKHEKFIDRRVMDFILFMKRTSLVGSEAEREAVLERLEAFRREYPAAAGGFIK